MKAEEEVATVTSGRRVALGRKFSKELLEDEDEDVKAQVRKMYREQRKTHEKGAKKNVLDDDDEGDCVFDAESITQYVFKLILSKN